MSENKPKAKRIDADGEAQALLAAQLERAKTERVPELLTLAVFVLFIAAFAVSFWIVPDRDFSENENRYLEQFPAVSFSTPEEREKAEEMIISGKFTEDFATYMADQFPLRDQFVTVNAAAEVALGKGQASGVFVLGDTLAERFDEVNEKNFERNVSSVDRFIAACRESGITAEFAVFGRAMDVTSVPIYGSAATDAAFALLDGHDHIDMRAALDGHLDEYVYYRTDHHHTTLGAFYAYEYLAPYLGYEANARDHYTVETASEEFYGTTWSKAGAKWIKPDVIEYYRWDGDESETVTITVSSSETKTHEGMYFTGHLSEKDKYASFLENSVYGRVDVTSAGEKPKLLVIKDSFAHSLVPFLAEHYDVTMIDPRYYAKPVIDLVDGEGFDAVLVCCNMDTLSSSAPFAKLAIGLD